MQVYKSKLVVILFSIFKSTLIFSQAVLTINSPQNTGGNFIASEDVKAVAGSKFVAGSSFNSRLANDKTIINPINANGNAYSGYSIYSTYTIDKNLPVGVIGGEHGVSNGQSYYNISIPMAPGTSGMVPKIGISYSSAQTDGLVGEGWSIGGISAISRMTSDFYHIGRVQEIKLNSSDLFSLDGNVIWGQAPGYTTANPIRRLENDNFTDVKVINNYSSFLVTTKEGMVMEYGNTTDSKLIVNDDAGLPVPLVYYINKVTDKFGNYFTYTYYNQNGEIAVKEIQYTGNANISLLPYNTVKFYYDTREDQTIKYFKGNILKKSFILREIETFCEGQSVKRFVPKYDFMDRKSYLTSITEYGLDGSHLNPTKFGYEISTSAMENVNIPSTQLPALADYKVADFNGDGKADVMAYLYTVVDATSGHRNYTGWELYINQNSGTTYSKVASAYGLSNFQAYSYYGLPNTYNAEADGTTAINLNGDDKEDAIFLQNSGTNTIYTPQFSTGTGFTPGSAFTIPAGSSMLFADIDGDKIPEGIGFYAATKNLYILNFKTNQYQVRFTDNALVDPEITGSGNTFKILQVIDYDGDGVQELLVEINSKARVLKVGNYIAASSSSASNFLLNVIAKDYLLPSSGAYSYENTYGDFNGDGMTDNLTRATTPDAQYPLSVPNSFFLRYNKGKYSTTNNSFFLSPSTLMASVLPGRNEVTKKVLLADMDNDGKSDIITLSKYPASSDFLVQISYGSDVLNRIDVFTVLGTTFPDAVNYNYYTSQAYPTNGNNIAEFALGDFDGDGYTDIMYKNTNSGQRSIIYNHPGITEGKLARVTNGFNQDVKYQYATLAKGGVYVKGSGSSYPIVDIQMPMKVVSSEILQDANGNPFTNAYTYEDAKMHMQGKGFLGFGKITVTNSLQQTKTVEQFDINTQYAKRLLINAKKYLLSNLTQPFAETQNAYVYVANGLTSGNPLVGHYVTLSQLTQLDNVSGNSSVAVYNYDNYLNVIDVTTTIKGGFQINKIINDVDQANLYGNNYPSFVKSITSQQTRISKAMITRVTKFDYLTNGLLQKVTSNLGAASCESNVVYTYYTNTNFVQTTTLNSTGNAPRSTNFNYESKYRFINEVINPVGYNQLAEYDNRWGLPTKTTDIWGLKTNYNYDAYGHNVSVTPPDNNTENYITRWYSSGDDISNDPFPASNALITSEVIAPNRPFSRSLQTASGLNVKNITQGFNQNFISDRSIYNNKGLLDNTVSSYLIPFPSSAHALTSTNVYDSFNKLISNSVSDGVSTPLSTSILYTYSGGNVTAEVTEPDGLKKKTITDPVGLVSSVRDKLNGLLTYDYYSNGLLKETVLNGNTVSQKIYDDCDQLSQEVDPNYGTTNYTFDGFKQLLARTNNAKTYSSFVYDQLGRLQSFNDPTGGQYLYQYVASGPGKGMLEQQTAPNGTSVKYYYDNLNRPKKTDQIIAGLSSGLTQIEYDQYSNPIKRIYPSGFAVKTSYDNLGFPVTMKNDATNALLWQGNEIDQFGHYTKFTLGNGNIQTVRTYDNFGFLTNEVAGSVFNHSYNFEPKNGNLKEMTDGIKNLKEVYSYDDLERLRSSTVHNLSTLTFLTPLTTTYDASGNITNKSDVGDYKYLGAKPNAVQFIKNPANVISSVQQDITYTAFEKAENITEGNETAVFTYGPSEERVKAVYANSSTGLSKTRYYTNSYEEEVSIGMLRKIDYINTPSGFIGMHVNENGSENTYFAYSDHLGTPKTITNSSGVVVAEQNFDAWGQRRNPATWDYTTIPAPPAWLYRGYTGHEHLPQFSLINMNGRMYDPQNGRMLSVDPVLHDASSSQAYNKYTYANNNPLKYTDPSGYDFTFPGKNSSTTINFGGRENPRNSEVDLYQTLISHPPPETARSRGYGGEFTEASGRNISSDWLIADAHDLWAENHREQDHADIYFITDAQTGLTLRITEINIIGYNSDVMYDYLRSKDKSNVGVMTAAAGDSNFDEVKTEVNEVNTGVGAFGLGLYTQTELFDYAIRNNYKSANSWKEFNNLRKTQQVWRTNNTLTKTGAKYLKGAKVLGKAVFAVTILNSAVNTIDGFARSDPNKWGIAGKAALDVAMGYVGFLGPIGFGISAGYYILDAAGAFNSWSQPSEK